MNFRDLFPFGKKKPAQDDWDVLDDWDDWDPDEEWTADLRGVDVADYQGNSNLMVVDVPDLVRRMLYDSGFEEAEEAMEILGYHRQSREVIDMTERESDERVDVVQPIAPLIAILINCLNQGLVAVVGKEIAAKLDIPEEEIQGITDAQNAQVVSAVIATVANLIDLGAIHLSGLRVVSVTDDNGKCLYQDDYEDED